MSITTRSSFYYGHTVTLSNFQVDFDEGSGEITADLPVGSYSLTSFAAQIAASMTDTGLLSYSATVDRATRKITISEDLSTDFDLLASSGTHTGTSALTLAGFSADKTVGFSHESDSASGKEYRPQFLLQEFVDFDDFQQASQAAVNVSASGATEVVSFGLIKMAEMSIKFASNIDQGTGNIIETNATGVADLREFLQDITGKSFFEFNPDRDAPAVFRKVILDKLSGGGSKDGTGYKLQEEYGKNMPGYFSSGKLTLREVS